ncbi:MAG TPA: hydantoinase B/oxoprolinase family protein [Candidatus Binataceae bacterium]|nr:hydantoinase B/oxoprolinase family protein [Candidatus Binataceae bacterium]
MAALDLSGRTAAPAADEHKAEFDPARHCRRPLSEVIRERDELTAKTGNYYGITELSLRDSDPLKYERFYARIHSAVLSAREVARYVAASPGSREMGESLWGLCTAEGDTLALSVGFLSHTTALPTSIRYMAEKGYDLNEGIRDADVFAVSDGRTGGVPHPGDFYGFVPIVVDGEIVAWAVGLNHIVDNGAPVAGSWATFSVDTFMDGLVLPPIKTGTNLKQASWWKAIWERRTRAATMNILDDKMRLAGMALIYKAVHEVIEEFGLDYYKRAIREIIEESRRMIVDNIRDLTVPGTYSGAAFRVVQYKGLQGVWSQADKNTLIHIRVAVEADPTGLLIDTEGSSRWGYHSYNGTPGGADCAVFLGMINQFAHNTKVTAGISLAVRRNYAMGSIYNPDNPHTSNANIWAQSIALNSIAFSSVCRAMFARGYLEEAFTVDGNWAAIQGGGVLADGTPYAFTNFEWLGGVGRGGFCYRDGEPLVWAPWSQVATIGDAEDVESTVPTLFYLGRRLLRGYFGAGKYRGGVGNSAIHWAVKPGQRLALSRPNGGLSCTPALALGMSGAYPAPGCFMITAQGTNLGEILAAGGKPPRDANEFLAAVEGGTLTVKKLGIWKTDCPEVGLENNDMFVDAAGAGGGWGDPLDRDPQAVVRDLNEGWVTNYEFTSEMHGVVAAKDVDGKWTLDVAATKAKRAQLRARRISESVPVSEWWQAERGLVRAGNFRPEVAEMYKESLSFEKFAREFKGFWQLEPSFTVQAGEWNA